MAEKAETNAGWLFPLGDEMSELGFIDMFTDMFDALDTGRLPRETLYDGYVVNAVMDACYRSAKSRAWEPVELFEWRGGATPRIGLEPEMHEGKVVIKRELMPDGRQKLIVKDPATRATSATMRRRRVDRSPAAGGGSSSARSGPPRLTRRARASARRAARRPSTRHR